MAELHRHSHDSSGKDSYIGIHDRLLKDWHDSDKHGKKHGDSKDESRKAPQSESFKSAEEKATAKLEQSGSLPTLKLVDEGPARPPKDAATADSGKPSTGSVTAGAVEAELSGSFVRSSQTANLEDGAFAKRSLAMFDRLDSDKDGFVSDKEAVAAMQDDRYVNEDAQTVAGLFRARQSLSRLHNDASIDLASTTVSAGDPREYWISREDLEAYGAMQESQRMRLNGLNAAKVYLNGDNFKKVDANGDGQVSREELARQFLDVKDEQEKTALHYLVDNYDTIRGANTYFGSSTISAADFKTHSTKFEATLESRAVIEVSSGISFTAQSQKPGVNYALFADGDAMKSISPEAIQQKSIGDCYFEASLASLAKERPQDIEKMIKDNSDGTYTVTFPGAPDEPVIVKAPTEAELGVYNGASEYGIWANVIEKAFGQYRQTHGLTSLTDWIPGRQERTPTDGADGGGWNTEAMNLLSAKKSSMSLSYWNSEDAIATEIKEALRDSRMVTCGTPGVTDKERLANGYPTDHAYSVVGYREDEQGHRFVTVRNPWGGKGKDGTSEVSIEEFKRTFDTFSIESK